MAQKMKQKSTKLSYQYAISVNFSILKTPIKIKDIEFSDSIILSSRRFKNLQNAAHSCEDVMVAWMNLINESQDEFNQYKMVVEINPEISGDESYSTDWQENQLSKLWIIPDSADFDTDQSIEAVSFANLVELTTP